MAANQRRRTADGSRPPECQLSRPRQCRLASTTAPILRLRQTASGIPVAATEPHIAELQEARNGEDNRSTEHDDHILSRRQSQSAGKLADAEVHFSGGPLGG